MKKIITNIFIVSLFTISFCAGNLQATGTLYLNQDFENVLFPPSNWSITNSSGYNWIWTSYCSGYGQGGSCAVADFYDFASGNFDLFTYTFPATTSGDSLVFDHAYTTGSSEVDRLDIYTSDNGGSTWTLLISLAGGTGGPLRTAPPTYNLFVPLASQWATKRYLIPVGTNKIKFTGVTAFGNNLYLDNIRVGMPYSNDVGANSLNSPKWGITPGSMGPVGTVKNFGTSTQSFQVTLTINPGAYTNTQTINNLAPGATQQVTFGSFSFSTNGLYTMKAYSSLGSDQNRANDTIVSYVTVTPSPRKVLLEYCTGTWCQWCPCGDSVAHHLAVTYPNNSVILSYHGPANSGSDPWTTFSGNNILSLLGLNAYPSGNIDRRGHREWGSFFSDAELLLSQYHAGTVNIVITNQNYNTGTRQLDVTFTATALQTLSGQYKVNYVITEDNLIYFQQGNSYCTGSSNWVHNWVVRNMVNGATGENVNSGTWNQNQTYTMSFSTTLNASWQAGNCKLQIFVYRENSPLNAADVQQGLGTGSIGPVGISNENSGVPKTFELAQNYPNPFNPATNIHFSIPKDGNASLKIYNSLGQLVATYLDGFIKAGYYNAEVDGTNMSSGTYFYTLTGKNFMQTKKMILVK
jgi:outer membrane protein Omp28/type IX secretion system substrate protein